METIKVKYFSDDMEELCYVAGKSDWIDLSAAEEVTLHAGDFQLIPLGVAIALPEGYEAHLAPRSSTFRNCRAGWFSTMRNWQIRAPLGMVTSLVA